MQVFARTDIGKLRKSNEDYYYVSNEDSSFKLYIIADGMGGYNAGEIASKMATETIKDYIIKNFAKNRGSREEIVDMLKRAVEYTNKVVYKQSSRVAEFQGMGTTLDVCLIYSNKMYIAHVGDSRVYRLRNNFFRRITKDHSYVQTLIEDGTITKEEAYYHPKKNMLTRALGCTEEVEPDIYVKTFLKGDILVMTTDGLTNMVRENEICEMLKESTNVDRLVDKANENGGLDNITVIIVSNLE